jgi:hypothetical protein
MLFLNQDYMIFTNGYQHIIRSIKQECAIVTENNTYNVLKYIKDYMTKVKNTMNVKRKME